MKQCKSILIAEDNDEIRETVEDALRSEGYTVEHAVNGKEALEKLRGLPSPSLVLLDLMMPVMSGWEFLDAQKVDAVFASHPVVTMSAVEPNESLEDKTPLKTAGSIPKPIDLNRLFDIVRKHCGPPPSA